MPEEEHLPEPTPAAHTQPGRDADATLSDTRASVENPVNRTSQEITRSPIEKLMNRSSVDRPRSSLEVPGPIKPGDPHHHHIDEFGAVENLVNIVHPTRPSEEHSVLPVITQETKSLKPRFARLWKRLVHDRHIHQYWQGDTLFRSSQHRSIGPDELFLDLVIVGGVAALGHELRETYNGWREVEKFLLLFSALLSSWRQVVFLWNMWGVSSDLSDKMGIYIVFTCLAFISLGAHGAFDDHIRVYVSVCSFLATAVPALRSTVWGLREPLLKVPGQHVSRLTFFYLVTIITALPYLAAAFVQTEATSRILFWVATISTLVGTMVSSALYKLLVPSHEKRARLAVAIELFVEKYDVLTMIVLGESVLGILFEGALVITKEGARLGHLFGATAMSTAMLYAMQTLYNNVDGPIAKGGKHAIRYRRQLGTLWSSLHLPYHAALVLFATGLGISFRDIAIPPTEEAVHAAVQAAGNVVLRAGDESSSLHGFDRKARWLFSIGYGSSILLSGLIGSLHYAGPRALTKKYRLLARGLIIIPIAAGMPLSNLSAENYVYVHGAILLFIALAEYVLVQMDKIGFFRSESMYGSSTDAEDGKVQLNFAGLGDDTSDDEDDSDEADGDVENQKSNANMNANKNTQSIDVHSHLEGQAVNSLRATDARTTPADEDDMMQTRPSRRERIAQEINEIQLDGENIDDEVAEQRLKERLCRSHTNRLVPAPKKKSIRDVGLI